jgi:hypothetical protein
MQLVEITQLIETSIAGLKLDISASRGEKPGQWTIKVKDSSVWIDVFDFPTSPGKFYLQVMSPLCIIPDKKKEDFSWDLLEINNKMYGSWMCKKENWIYVLSLREADGLDQSEVDATIDRVSFYSSDYFSKLGFKYEGCWLPKAPTVDKVPGSPQ